MNNMRNYRLTLRAADIDAFLEECERVEWRAYDTGERIMTDDGPDAEAVLLLELTATAPQGRAVPVAH